MKNDRTERKLRLRIDELEEKLSSISVVLPVMIAVIMKILNEHDPESLDLKYLIDLFKRSGFDFMEFKQKTIMALDVADIMKRNPPNLVDIARGCLHDDLA